MAEIKLPPDYKLLCDAGKILFWQFYAEGETLWLCEDRGPGPCKLPIRSFVRFVWDDKQRRAFPVEEMRVEGKFYLLPERLVAFDIIYPSAPI
jgi:hypothetical protein